MNDSYDLAKLTPDAFEHLVNSLTLRVLGSGATGFGPGPDGGRDGCFEGSAPYPSNTEHWSGIWYVQSKFHAPHLSKNPQIWLLNQISKELRDFQAKDSKRKWPDIWIIATNIDPSGSPDTGAFDAARNLVRTKRPKLADRFHIWGGAKILDFLSKYKDVAGRYRHLITPGHLLTEMFEKLRDDRASVSNVLHYLIVRLFQEHQHTRLEEAGSDADKRPGVHQLFIDLPYYAPDFKMNGSIMESVVHASARDHRIPPDGLAADEWQTWTRDPRRARVWFVKGGPGQGKSTTGQYFSQLQRAALILHTDKLPVHPNTKLLAAEVRRAGEKSGFWPASPRIPIYIELKDYAQWYGGLDKHASKGILTYLAQRIAAGTEQRVPVGLLKRMLADLPWFVLFDGLDEVPEDVKDLVSIEVIHFLNDVAVEVHADLMAMCTSRPQGYSGQFSNIDGPTIELQPLSREQALACATPVIKAGRSEAEAEKAISVLESALGAEAVRALMTTPLQSHIMAIVVRDGGRPPERRWQLFDNFYQVIRRREANRNLPDKAIAALIRDQQRLLKAIHNRLGFVLHARAEKSIGAQTSLNKIEFRMLAETTVKLMMTKDVAATVDALVVAARDRLVLVNTPDDGQHVRFDVRQLQEFFAAEFLYESVNAGDLKSRIESLSGDAHWREVLHFLLSALVENGRQTELDGAVEALSDLNDGFDGAELRTLSRRLSLGAVLAVRLLAEGVLEQDRRVRQQFAKILEPVFGVTCPTVLLPLLAVNQPNSLDWLVKLLRAHLNEKTHSENVGAAILLTRLLPENDPEIESFKVYLLDSPPDYAAHVLIWSGARNRIGRNIPPPNWMREMALRLLLRPSWIELESGLISDLLGILRSKGTAQLDVAVTIGLSRAHVQLLQLLLEDANPSAQEEDGRYGIVRVFRFSPDWSRAQSKTVGLPAAALETEPDQGILSAVNLVFRFARTRKAEDLRELAAFVEKLSAVFEIFPEWIRALAPFDARKGSAIHAKQILEMPPSQQKDFIASLTSARPPFARPFSRMMWGSVATVQEWRRLIEDYPRGAFSVWSNQTWVNTTLKRRPKTIDDKEALLALADKLVEFPLILLGRLSKVARLIAAAPEREDALRDALKFASNAKPKIAYRLDLDSAEGFPLRLPGEACLLPHVLNSIANTEVRKPEDRGARTKHQLVSELCKQYFPSTMELLNIQNAKRVSIIEKACAVILNAMCDDKCVMSKAQEELIVEAARNGAGMWFYSAVVYCVRLDSMPQDFSHKLIDGLLETARHNYSVRVILEELLADWRERSTAPVSANKFERLWLREQDDVH